MNKFIFNLLQLLIYILFSYPFFKISIINFMLILILLASIIYRLTRRENKINFQNVFILSIPFLVISINSLFYLNQNNWYEAIPNAIPFFSIPLTFALLPEELFTKDKIYKYLNVLKVTCAFVSLSYIVLFLNKYSFEDFFSIGYRVSKFRVFVYDEINIFKIHPTYFTSILVVLFASSLNAVFKRKKFYEILFLIIFPLISMLLLTKVNIVLMFLIMAYYLLFMTNYKKRNKIIITLFFSISFLLSAILIPGIKVRFLETFQSFNSVPKGVAYDSTNIRVAIYKCDLELLKDNFWLGIGSNNLKTDIRNCFASNYDAEFYKENYYITHNYFIYILLSTGIIGFLFFAYYLYYFSKKILATKWLEPIVLLISTIIICFSEDYFYRNFGMFNFSILSLTFLKNKSFI